MSYSVRLELVASVPAVETCVEGQSWGAYARVWRRTLRRDKTDVEDPVTSIDILKMYG
jgi:hypothetical protein